MKVYNTLAKSQPLPAREVISRKLLVQFVKELLVSTPPGEGGHFKDWTPPWKIWKVFQMSQPLPAREVISRASILALMQSGFGTPFP